MPAAMIDHVVLRRLADQILADLGLSFDESRWPDLRRHLQEMVASSPFSTLKSYLHWLFEEATTAERIATLASHLTIGETYFFRDPAFFTLLQEEILPTLILAQAGRPQRKITIWSAGCSSGEEPYSIAIAASQCPGLEPEAMRILASDVNAQVLAKAMAGVFTSWSFRNPPPHLLDNYFTRQGENAFQLSPVIQERVRFLKINLMAAHYPSPLDQAGGVDLIFCRNVLMYFDGEGRARIIEHFVRLLAKEGWLIVSPSETAFIGHPELRLSRRQGCHFFQKGSARPPFAPVLWHQPEPPLPALSFAGGPGQGEGIPDPQAEVGAGPSQASVELGAEPALLVAAEEEGGRVTVTVAQALAFLKAGEPEEACRLLLALVDDRTVVWSSDRQRGELLALLARLQADGGELAAAEERYRQAIAADKLNPSHYFHLAMILQARLCQDEAVIFLKKTIFLEPDFLLAHFQLACLLKNRREAGKYAKTALALAGRLPPEEIVPHSEGITVGLLQETLNSLLVEKHG